MTIEDNSGKSASAGEQGTLHLQEGLGIRDNGYKGVPVGFNSTECYNTESVCYSPAPHTSKAVKP